MTASFKSFRLQLLLILGCRSLAPVFAQYVTASVFKNSKELHGNDLRIRAVYRTPIEQKLCETCLNSSYIIAPQNNSA